MKNLKKSLILLTVVGFVLGFSLSLASAAEGDNNKININTATVEQLMQLKGVGQKIAEAIVAYREANGLFKSVADLEQVKGIGPKILADNMDRLTI